MGSRHWRAYKIRKQKEGNWRSVPVKHQFYCPAAGRQKLQYKSEKSAQLAIKHFQPEYEGQKVPVRSYYCSRCCAWHTTSRP